MTYLEKFLHLRFEIFLIGHKKSPRVGGLNFLISILNFSASKSFIPKNKGDPMFTNKNT